MKKDIRTHYRPNPCLPNQLKFFSICKTKKKKKKRTKTHLDLENLDLECEIKWIENKVE